MQLQFYNCKYKQSLYSWKHTPWIVTTVMINRLIIITIHSLYLIKHHQFVIYFIFINSYTCLNLIEKAHYIKHLPQVKKQDTRFLCIFIYKQISKHVIPHLKMWQLIQDLDTPIKHISRQSFIHQHQILHHLDWSGSSAAHSFPYPTPPPSASLAGCSSSSTSLWGT